ncbi:MAG: hypothetical protein BWY64_02292 [bacterium ADurb.Bin363]|nr:MAG: hypothetical protein BWY64_02292 [bacterium ADurb.Bin363]
MKKKIVKSIQSGRFGFIKNLTKNQILYILLALIIAFILRPSFSFHFGYRGDGFKRRGITALKYGVCNIQRYDTSNT